MLQKELSKKYLIFDALFVYYRKRLINAFFFYLKLKKTEHLQVAAAVNIYIVRV